MGKPSKILLVSASLFPKRSGSAYITEKLARQFTRQEMAVAGELRVMGRPAERPSQHPATHYIRSGLSLFGRGARFLSALRWRLLGRVAGSLVDIARRERCDYVIGTYPDELYCYAALLAAQKLGVPFSAYFHNTYLDNEAIQRRRAAKLQPLFLAAAEHVFAISAGLADFLRERYSLANAVVLPHMFDNYPPESGDIPSRAQAGKTRLVLFGNFNESNMEATRRLVDAAVAAGTYEVNLYTHVPSLLLQQRGLNMAGVVHRGFIDDSLLVEELRQYDIVVLTHGFTGAYGAIEYRTIFPTRTIPALLSGRPILLHSPPGSFLTEFVQKHNVAVVVAEPSSEKLVAGLERLRSDPELARRLCQAARVAAAAFHGPRVADVLRRTIGLTASAHRATSLPN
jgi:glycosyltransferase involved in cell wall biosynthesis